MLFFLFFFFFNDTATTEIYTLSLHDALPISGPDLRGGAVAAVRAAQCGADAEALFGEVEADARVAAQAVEIAPDDVRCVDAALADEILHQPAQIVFRQGGDDAGALAPALAHGAGDIVFAAAFPHLELAGGAHAAEAGIEAQHHLAERDTVPFHVSGGADLQHVAHAYCPRMRLMRAMVSATFFSIPA